MAVENEAKAMAEMEGLLRKLANSYTRYGFAFEDALQEVKAIAITACRAWEPNRDTKLTTLVTIYVKNRMPRILAERFTISVPVLKWNTIAKLPRMRSMDAPGASGYSLHETLPHAANQEDALDDAERKHIVQKALRQLTAKERRILVERFTEDKTLDDIGKGMGLTRERIRQIEVKALEKLRKSLACLEAA